MKTKDLFRIFSADQIGRLSDLTIKTLKKEMLLEFQLTDEPTVSFNGHQLDKNEVITIFEKLQPNLQGRLQKYNETIVDNFIKEGDLDALLSAQGPAVMRSIINRPDLRNDLLYKTSEIIANMIITATDDRSDHIHQVRQLTTMLPHDLENRAYSTALRYLRSEIEAIKTRYTNPFKDNFTLELEPEMKALVDVRFIDLILQLPQQFHFLAYEYALWCVDFIIALTSYRENKWTSYPINSLLVIRDASLIATQFYDNPEHLQRAHEITRLLEDPAKLAKSWKKRKKKKSKQVPARQDRTGAIIAIIVAVVMIIRFILLLSER